VGTDSGDDAAVWQISPERALVVTVDFITPIVDEPYIWGQIAAANAVSDIYAMGGEPIFALNLVNWNSSELPASMLVELLKGASDKANEGNWLVVGGHSVEDPEPKYGMCVVGEVDPRRLLNNTALRPGDSLILTKPLGTGILTTAIKAQSLSQERQNTVVKYMRQLNRGAKDVAVKRGAAGATDITGFGLLGHLKKMIADQRLDAHLELSQIPLMDGAYQLAKAKVMPGGSKRNLDWVRPALVTNGQDETDLIILADAQTSGGLLFGVEPAQVAETLVDLAEAGYVAAMIGQVAVGRGKIILSAGHINHEFPEFPEP
jgi:selenide,water dikinase